jgi:nitrite reductase/ring-hydroxylating ferredoxin subunit
MTAMTSRPDRRRALTIAAGVGLTPAALAACGGDDPGSTAADEGALDTGHTAGTPDSGPLTSASEVPVGGGVIFPDQQVVVTQPAEGEFKCFTAVCTHQGCTVGTVEDGEIRCPCNGSRFSAEDGSVTSGPASSPLEEFEVSVEGDQVVRA